MSINPDSGIGHMLITTTRCSVYSSSREIDVECLVDDVRVSKRLSFDEVSQVHPKLPETLETLSKYSNDMLSMFALKVRVITSHLLGRSIDLGTLHNQTLAYPYITDITKVSTSKTDNAFIIECSNYNMNTPYKNGVSLPYFSDQLSVKVDASILDKIWPDGANRVSLMESLGYDNEHIAQDLLSNTHIQARATELPNIDFD